MQIHCLGTTGYHPSPSRHTACYYLPDVGLVLDAGTGLFRLIPLLRENPRRELSIVLSHAHLDHVMGLTFLLDVMASTEVQRVRVFAKAEKAQAIREHLFNEHLFPVPLNFELVELQDPTGTFELDDWRVDYFPLEHPGGSIGFVVSAQQKRIAYITDTSPIDAPEFVQNLMAIDLLMHECYFDDSQAEWSMRTGHSWLSAVTRLVQQVQPKQTLLIHVNPLAGTICAPIQLDSIHGKLNMRFAEDNWVIDV